MGAQTVLRDSSGVPVVRALEGPARIAPEDPGGLLVAHQGLTVNEVAGSQVIGSANDPLQLAPRPINLQAEDQPIQSLLTRDTAAAEAPASAVLPEPIMDPAEALIIDETAESLAAMLAAGTVNGAVTEAPAAVIPASAGSGLTQSLRPRLRPLCWPRARHHGPNRQISRPARLFAVRRWRNWEPLAVPPSRSKLGPISPSAMGTI